MNNKDLVLKFFPKILLTPRFMILSKKGGNILNLLLSIIFSILVVFSLSQARVLHIPIEEIFVKADFIIRGTVIDSKSRRGDREIMIFTDYTIQILENIKGNSPSHIVMSFAGGTVGDKSIFITDTPTLEVGEEYIICGYGKEKKYAVPVVGSFQGVFRVVHDEVKNTDIIVDYNWYQLEITDGQEIIKGLPIQKDSSGALTVKEDVRPTKKEPASPPIDRDAYGNILPQVDRVYKASKAHPRGKAVTKTGLIDFIKRTLQ